MNVKNSTIQDFFHPTSNIEVYSYCPLCCQRVQVNDTMAAVPQGAFAAKKVRENEERRKNNTGYMDLTPMNYSSKFMNSIWGEYNRYSVHNLKKIMDDGVLSFNLGKQENKNKPQGVKKSSVLPDIGSPLPFNINVITHQ